MPALIFLFWVRSGFGRALTALGLPPRAADILAKGGPVIAVVLTILAASLLELGAKGVDLVGAIPSGLPPFAVPSADLSLIERLWVPALLISIIGFVESVSVARTLAAKRRQRISPTRNWSASARRTSPAPFRAGIR